jgi:hypothetical protein
MSFESDLFISYAHLDDEKLTAEQQGWVSNFRVDLKAFAGMEACREVKIWQDPRLAGNDVFDDEIAAQIPKAAILVCVLSPRYTRSDSCKKEVLEFLKAAEQSGGVVLDNKSRVIKIIKIPVHSEGLSQWPPLMQKMLGIEFFTVVEGDIPLELDRTHGEELKLKYDIRLRKLAMEINETLNRLEPAVPGAIVPAPPPSSRPAVYLAECSYDRQEAREALQMELQEHGYSVLPDQRLATEEAEYVVEVARLLERCSLSVHLIGGSFGLVPDGPSRKSVVVLQNELAIRRTRSGGLRRLIWLPGGTGSTQPEQQQFIQALLKDAEAQFGADLITADLETLKGAIHATLQKLEKQEEQKKAEPEPVNAGGAKLIYLICDVKDREATIPMRRFLTSQGLVVKIPVFEGGAEAVRVANQSLLTLCDALLVFYGAGDEAWKRTVEIDLEKRKYHTEKRLLANFTYLSAPATADKQERVELQEANLINGLGGFLERAMSPFIAALQP